MVEAGRSTFQLATLPKEDFPVMAASDYAANFAAPAPMLRRLFDKSKFAISTEETRYYLNGVYFHVAEGEDGPALRRGHRRPPAGADRRALPDGARTCPA
jgi:DNA polymerase-3 subunit beta